MKKLLAALLMLPSLAFAEAEILAGYHQSFEKEFDDEAAFLSVNADFDVAFAGLEAYELNDDFEQQTLFVGSSIKGEYSKLQAGLGVRKVSIGDEDETEAVVKLTASYAVAFVDVVAGESFTDTTIGAKLTINNVVASLAWRENRIDIDDVARFDMGGPQVMIGYGF